MALIHPPEKGASRLVGGARNGFRARKVVDRLGGVEGRPLECRRQKTGSPAVDARLGRAARVGDGDVCREVVVLAAQRVTGPRSHAREPLQRVAGAHVVFARAVRVRLAGERVDEAQLVRHLPDVRNEIGDLFAALTVRPERPWAPVQASLFALKGDEAAGSRQGLAVAPDELRLVVEGVNLAARPGAENHQHLLRLGPCVRVSGGIRSGRHDVRPERRLGRPGAEQLAKRDPAQPHAGVHQKLPPAKQRPRWDG